MRIDNIIEQVTDSLYKIWDDLKEQYCVNTDFVICSTSSYLKIKNEYHRFDMSEKPLDELINDLSANENNGTLIETLSTITIDGNNKVHVHSVVCLRDETLYELILRNIGRIDLLIEYLKQSLLHEMGHVLCNLDYENKTIEEWRIEICEKKVYEDRQTREYAEQIDDPDEYMLTYFNLPGERSANDRVGLTAEDMVKMDKEICEPMNIKIEVLKDE